MTTIDLRALTPAENAEYERLIAEGVEVDDDRLVGLVANGAGRKLGNVEAPRPVESKLDLARALDRQLSEVLATHTNLREDPGLWNSLSIHWRNAIWGKGTAHGSEFFVFRESSRDRYRHRLAGPYFLANRFAGNSKLDALLGALAPDSHGELLEQLLSRQYVFLSDAAWHTAAALYLDKGQIKRGALGKGGGSVRRFGIVMQQLAVTYDMTLIDPPSLMSLLPDEFDRFK